MLTLKQIQVAFPRLNGARSSFPPQELRKIFWLLYSDKDISKINLTFEDEKGHEVQLLLTENPSGSWTLDKVCDQVKIGKEAL